ncbi:MAG: aldolase, partial [Halobacteriales archaeon]|nr:aldolase [Halobacteriales archaeon]
MRHENELRERLEDGSVAFGARGATFSPALVEVYGSLGLDFVWLDFEHTGASPLDSLPFEHLARAAETADVSLLA